MNENLVLTRTIAMAGIYELALTVKQIAWFGHDNTLAIDKLLMPILHQENEEENPIAIYSDKQYIFQGLKTFLASMEASSKNDREINRYVFSLIYLAKKLNKNNNMLAYISRELDHIRDLTGLNQDFQDEDNDNFYAIDDEQVIRQLAAIYQNSISKLGPRILISGKPENLAQETTAQTIRALLLSGIRSAILWYRNGGSRLNLLFDRSSYIHTCKELLKTH